ncbi:MAG: acetyl-CoA carboxylase, biotin carboxyl carrier protein [Flavobacteriaceae bacterium]|nr:acetyl-CoA carboxylase, biotin carboxyl carrier protein [Flavobacteriaceae bacterium]|tara:strand:+ start:585950 stop:586438 length:489 start_codon:yes stop_codon:yes gene_type:complete
MDIKEIQNLIRFVAKSGASEVSLETEDVKLTIKTGSEKSETTIVQSPIQSMPAVPQQQIIAQPVAEPQPAAPAKPAAPAESNNYVEIKSPMIGTFYRKPSPDKPNFVDVGSDVKVGDTVCVIEAMKLFNEIESEISGKIVKVLVEDATPVEFDQPLFLVDPS